MVQGETAGDGDAHLPLVDQPADFLQMCAVQLFTVRLQHRPGAILGFAGNQVKDKVDVGTGCAASPTQVDSNRGAGRRVEPVSRAMTESSEPKSCFLYKISPQRPHALP
ncbi:MAG TPA: hypothetical protein VE690_14030 [Rhodopila sp.]|nr:hypothetical protein [Rhodopila sp.]